MGVREKGEGLREREGCIKEIRRKGKILKERVGRERERERRLGGSFLIRCKYKQKEDWKMNEKVRE